MMIAIVKILNNKKLIKFSGIQSYMILHLLLHYLCYRFLFFFLGGEFAINMYMLKLHTESQCKQYRAEQMLSSKLFRIQDHKSTVKVKAMQSIIE